MGQSAARDEEGRPREPYGTFLVLDPERGEIWIEDRGHVLEEYHSELPARMTWAVYHDAGNGANSLGGVVRLKYRGSDLHRHHPEIVWLAGQRTKEYLAFHLTDHDLGTSHTRDGGPFRPYHGPTPRKPGVRYYGSFLVSEAEYEQARASWADASRDTRSSRRLLTTALDENKAAWAKVRRKLYQAIEGQVNQTGYRLRHLQVRPGPDYSAAHARMQVDRAGIIRNLLGRTWSLDPYLMIDYLGNDIWYAQIVPNPQVLAPPPHRPNPAGELLPEFLVSAEQAIPPAARRAGLEKGRARQREYTESQNRWTVTLANGAVVRFLGIGEYPSSGKPWWGPDGRPIDYAPCFPPDPENRSAGGGRGFEFAWRVQHPEIDKPQGLSVQHRFEGGSAFSTIPYCDRYGVVPQDGHHESCLFARSQEKTTLTIDTKLNDQGLCTVKFKNLALVPGQDQGFEIEVVK
jgi:hypothetical protein